MDSLHWKNLSSGDHAELTKAARELNRSRPGAITTQQAHVLLTALLTTSAAGHKQRAEAWPALLELLARFAAGSGQTRLAAGLQARRPLRPWEQQQQQSNTALQRQQQRDHETLLRQSLLQQALAAVLAALRDAAPAGAGADSSAVHALLPVLAPAVAFLASATPAVSGPDASELQQAAVAAACSAAAAALPLMLAEQPGLLPQLLWSYQQLMLTCKEQPQWLAWLLCCLLAALDDSLPPALQHKCQQLLHQQQQRFKHSSSSSSSSSGDQAAAAAALQSWAQQQVVELSAAESAQYLSHFYTLGHQLGLTLCRAAAAAAASGADSSPDLQHSSLQAVCLQGLSSLGGLLQAACREGSQQLAAAAGSVAAGMAAGCLEAAAASVGTAGAAAVEDVWAATVAAATPVTARHQVAGHPHHHTAPQHSRGIQQPGHVQRKQQQRLPPQLVPNWVQQLQQQALLLAAAAEAACERCSHQAVPAAGPSATNAASSAAVAASHFCKLMLGHAYSKLMSGHGPTLQQQQQRQAQSASGTLCSLSYLLKQGCGMAGLFHYAGCCGDAATANLWLAAQQQQHQPHEVGMLVQWLASAVPQLQSQGMVQLLAALRQSAEELASSYSWYLQASSKGVVLQGVDAAAARQQLDRLFAVHVALLGALWQGAAAAGTAGAQVVLGQQQPPAGPGGVCIDLSAAVAAEGLAALAALQFCQVQLPSYVELLRSLITAVASSSAAADAFLAAALPCYDSLLQPLMGQAGNWLQQQQQQQGEVAAGGDKQAHSYSSNPASSIQHPACGSGSSSSIAARAWMANPVVIARLSFAAPLMPLACKASADQAAAAAASLPLLLLLVPHPVVQVSQAAHSAVAGLFSLAAAGAAAGAQTAEEVSASAMAAGQQPNDQQQQQQLLQRTVEQAVPLYLQRSLDALPGFGSMEGLTVGFNSIIRQLPAGSVMALLAVKFVVDRAVQLAQQGSSSVHTQQQQQQRQQVALDAANKLFELVQLALEVVDYALLPSLLQLVAAAVLAAPAAVQRRWLSGLYGSCLAVDDYTRKPGLVSWIDELARQVALREGQQQQQNERAVEQDST